MLYRVCQFPIGNDYGADWYGLDGNETVMFATHTLRLHLVKQVTFILQQFQKSSSLFSFFFTCF